MWKTWLVSETPEIQLCCMRQICRQLLFSFPSVTDPRKRLKWYKLHAERNTWGEGKLIPMASQIHSEGPGNYDSIPISFQTVHFGGSEYLPGLSNNLMSFRGDNQKRHWKNLTREWTIPYQFKYTRSYVYICIYDIINRNANMYIYI